MADQRFLLHIHYFRAIAILFVVIGHVFYVPWFNTRMLHNHVYSNGFLLFANATVFFVLISGFLFHHINDSRRYRYGFFIRKKLLHVYLPMLVMSTPALVYRLASGPLTAKAIGAAAFSAAAGLLLPPYWYIPFIMIVFVTSPVLRWFVRQRIAIIATPLMVLTGFFLFPRTLTFWPGVLPYFFPVFLLGAMMSQHYDWVRGQILRFAWLWIILATACMMTCAIMPYRPESILMVGIFSLCFGCFKVFLAFVFWGLMIKCEHRKIRFLDLFANYSFGVYFIHSYFLLIGLATYNTLWPPLGVLSYLATLAYIVAVPLASLGLAMLIKRVWPRHARYIAGV